MQWLRATAILAIVAGVFLPPHFDVASVLPPSDRAYVITDDIGGYVDEYENRYTLLKKRYQQVKIDGECSSSCTIVFAYFPLDKICVTERAWLGFHSPTEENDEGEWVPTAEGAKEIMDVYPASIQQWIEQNGGLKEEMIFLAGAELQKHLAPCGTLDTAAVTATSAK